MNHDHLYMSKMIVSICIHSKTVYHHSSTKREKRKRMKQFPSQNIDQCPRSPHIYPRRGYTYQRCETCIFPPSLYFRFFSTIHTTTQEKKERKATPTTTTTTPEAPWPREETEKRDPVVARCIRREEREEEGRVHLNGRPYTFSRWKERESNAQAPSKTHDHTPP